MREVLRLHRVLSSLYVLVSEARMRREVWRCILMQDVRVGIMCALRLHRVNLINATERYIVIRRSAHSKCRPYL